MTEQPPSRRPGQKAARDKEALMPRRFENSMHTMNGERVPTYTRPKVLDPGGADFRTKINPNGYTPSISS